MTERSMFWSDGLGDGGPYSEDELRLLYDALAGAEDANRGVLVNQGNELAPSSTGNNNIRIAIGRAVVDGTLYENDAILDIITASPAIGTTGRRCVLQKDWAARTVRAVIITSADGVGAIPALTQNDGTIWEIPICSFTITTGGVIGALTDQREFCEGIDPVERTRYLWLHPNDFFALLGAPTLGQVGAWKTGSRSWRLDGGGASEGLSTKIALPADWKSGTVSFTAYYQGVGADADDRRLMLAASSVTPGVDSMAVATDIDVEETVAHGNGILTPHTFTTGLTVAAGDIVRVAFGRDSSHGDDTNTDDMDFYGMRLEYTADY